MNKKKIDIDKINFENKFISLKSDYEIEPKQVYGNREYQFFGEDNLFTNYLIKLSLNSAVHSAILATKTNLTVGDGIIADDEVIQKLDSLDDEPFSELLYKIAYDYVLFGGFALGVIWSRDGSEIAKVYHIDFSTVRAEKKQPGGKIKNYYVSSDWEFVNQPENEPVIFPTFDKQENKEQVQLLYYRKYTPGFSYYCQPDYKGALDIIDLDTKINNFHINNIENGLLPSVLIHIAGNPSPEEAAKIRKKITESFGGTSNAGKFFLSFFEDVSLKTDVTPINQNQNHEYFLALNEKITQAILSAHRLSSPVLAGLPGGASLNGSGSEIATASELFYNTVIKNYQNDIINVFYKLLNVNFDIANNQPVRFVLSEGILANILSKNELREIVGFDAINEAQGEGINEEKEIEELIKQYGIHADDCEEIRELSKEED